MSVRTYLVLATGLFGIVAGACSSNSSNSSNSDAGAPLPDAAVDRRDAATADDKPVGLVDGGDAATLSGWPNMPPGYTVITDQPMNSKTPTIGNDWGGTFPVGIDNSGGPQQGAPLSGFTTDPTDPFSPSGVWFAYTPVGSPGAGSGPGPNDLIYDLPGISGPPTDYFHTLYVGGFFKIDALSGSGEPYRWPDSNGHKVYFVTEEQHDMTPTYGGGSAGFMWLEIAGTGASGTVVLVNQCDVTSSWLAPNVTTTTIKPGEWHRYEMLFSSASDENVNDGVIKVWVDGVLNIDLSNVPTRGKLHSHFGSVVNDWMYGGNSTVLTPTMGSQHARTGHMILAKP